MIKILVPVNFSDYSLNALNYALKLAEKFQSEVTLLYCFSDYLSREENKDKESIEPKKSAEIESLEQNYRERMRQLTQKVIDDSKPHKNIRIQYRFEFGYPEDLIPQISKIMKSEVIIMGTSKKEGAIKQAMGSITGDVVNKAIAPVLAVPANSKVDHHKIGKVLFLMELSDRDFFSLHRLIRIITPFKTEVIAVHHHSSKSLSKEDELRIEKLKEYSHSTYRNHKIDFDVIKGSDFAQSIEEYVTKNDFDLVAMTRRRRTLLRKLFSPSATKKMLYETDVPLLIFHS
ncbi:MAG TPA: universal stress protein [Marinilabiliaceae bacterium]|nr:universal stress protein [Marinilabiliaceae bacterium]